MFYTIWNKITVQQESYAEANDEFDDEQGVKMHTVWEDDAWRESVLSKDEERKNFNEPCQHEALAAGLIYVKKRASVCDTERQLRYGAIHGSRRNVFLNGILQGGGSLQEAFNCLWYPTFVLNLYGWRE